MRLLLSAIRLLFTVVFVVLLTGLILGPPLYLEVAGAVAPGEVVAKREQISPKSANWSRDLILDVSYRPARADERTVRPLRVDAATYDATPVESSVRVRYLPGDDLLTEFVNLSGARLETQPPFGALVARAAGLAPFLIGLAVAVALGWASSRLKRWWLALPIIPLALAGVFFGTSGWQPPLPAGEVRAGTATAREITRIDRAWGTRRRSSEPAAQPYLLVELEFVPEGRAGRVVAVDMVDEGSVRGLERQARVAITYSLADPRRARIDGATRTYVWKNLSTSGLAIILLSIAVAGLIALGGRLRGRRRAPPPP